MNATSVQYPHYRQNDSPWGEIQDSYDYSNGVSLVTTSGHGGLIVPVRIARKYIPTEARAFALSCSRLLKDGRNAYETYEEDTAAMAVIAYVPGIAEDMLHGTRPRRADELRASARATIRNILSEPEIRAIIRPYLGRLP